MGRLRPEIFSAWREENECSAASEFFIVFRCVLCIMAHGLLIRHLVVRISFWGREMKFLPTLGGSMSGSLGGLTASHNKGGQYMRRRSVPVNPNTARQQLVRSALGGLVQAWSDELSESQRQSWRNFASAVPVTDRLGQSITLSGQQWFIKANTPRLQLGGYFSALGAASRVDDAPTTFNTGEAPLDITTFDVGSASNTVQIMGDLAAAASDDGEVVAFIGPPQNPGRRFFKGPYQLATAAPVAASATTFSMTADVTDVLEWVSDTQPAVADEGVFFPLRIIMLYDDGRPSQPLSLLVALADVTP